MGVTYTGDEVAGDEAHSRAGQPTRAEHLSRADEQQTAQRAARTAGGCACPCSAWGEPRPPECTNGHLRPGPRRRKGKMVVGVGCVRACVSD